MIAICLSKQQELNADPNAKQQIIFAGSLCCFKFFNGAAKGS